MIRRTLEAAYSRLARAAKGIFGRAFGGLTRRGGLMQFLYVLLVVALMGGFINATFFPVPNQGQIVSPGPGAETIPEAIIDMFVVLIGGAGIYIAYVSGRQTTRSRMVGMYLGFAILLIAVSIFMGTYLSTLKG